MIPQSYNHNEEEIVVGSAMLEGARGVNQSTPPFLACSVILHSNSAYRGVFSLSGCVGHVVITPASCSR